MQVACANEWVRGLGEKPRIKCADCPNRRFLPVTDGVFRWHSSGRDPDGQPFVVGMYPLLQENGYLALRFLAEDVGRELNMVLDAILRALSRRRVVSNHAPLGFVRRG
jgi:hypothetical protein